MINGRYHLQSKLGQGGMGIVHRALDRLTGDTVALKQVQAPLRQLQFMSKPAADVTNDLRLALAQEFQTLATLRHPHIISVLDFGFTAVETKKQQPFYTMAYLSEAESLLQASKELSVGEKIGLILQVLQGLAYLHRRGILHRDLKPENVLVTAGQARLLDFGLAIRRDETSKVSSGGSLAYMAPELWLQKMVRQASDLFAVGIMAFEMLAGVHPFAPLDAWFTGRVLSDEPDWELLTASGPLPEDLITVIQKLLVKDPMGRYQRAKDVSADLQFALGRPASRESEAIRESYLQAAEFVGRETEMAQLEEALAQAANGPGVVWLIGGESGVGKSRLMDEVRARALVAGWQVMVGQTEAAGGIPYQLWQEIIPRLVLNSTLSDLELGVLRQAAPAVDRLLNKTIPEPATLIGNAEQQRLVLTLGAVLQRQAQPTLLILEDLQRANESLAPIKQLLKMQDQTPGVMVLATYRDDERPNLPNELTGSKLIQLERLPDQQIAKLGQAMLGKRATTPQIISLLVQETEGNTFFIVEVMRALAEEAGQLDEVGSMDLPTDVLTSGMKQLLQRRIQRVPAADQPLLQLAAVAGRVLDLALLQALAQTTDIEGWLQRISETAVLTVRDNQWLFAHDKLREAILVDLHDDQRRQLHRQVAEVIETTYPDNKAYYEPLLEHWHQAGDVDKELYYLPLAFVQTVYASGNYEQAGSLINRSLESLPRDDPRRAILQARQVYSSLHTGKVAEAQSLGLEALELARKYNNQAALAMVLQNLGLVNLVKGALDEALGYFEESILVYEALGDEEGLANSFNSLGNIAHYRGDLEQARAYYEKSLARHRTVGNQHNIGRVLGGLGLIWADLNDNETAETYLRQSLDILKEIGDKSGTAATLINLGFLQLTTNQDEAPKTFHQALVICQNIQLIPYILEIIVGFAWLFEAQEKPVRAEELAALAGHHPAQNSDIEWRLNGFQEKLAEQLSPVEFKAAKEKGQAMDLDKVVQTLLQEFSDSF